MKKCRRIHPERPISGIGPHRRAGEDARRLRPPPFFGVERRASINPSRTLDNKIVANNTVRKWHGARGMALRKAGANWVEGPDRFFDRETELSALRARVNEGTHTLLTAQRRMGKTSLVRELLRRLEAEGRHEIVFVDLEDAADAADAIATIASEAKSVTGVWRRVQSLFGNALQEVGNRVEELAVAEARVKLRAAVDAGNWRRKGDGLFAALAESGRPVVLAIDELPILVGRLLKAGEDIVPEGKENADAFLSWLRKNGQAHRGHVVLILSGSVGLEPILRQAGLSAQANIYSPLDLKPWDLETASACIAELAATYGLRLPPDVRHDMCRRLRCRIPHHVQLFFDLLHEHLRRANRQDGTLEDVERVYIDEMLSVRGQADLQHYETRLRLVLGKRGYAIALELLTEAAVGNGFLSDGAVALYRKRADVADGDALASHTSVEAVLLLLEHDGYLERQGAGYRFVSGLLEDWWRGRFGHYFVPIADRDGTERPA